MATYKVLVGIEYGDTRVEEGDIASDIPSKSVPWLLSQGIIEEVSSGKNSRAKKTEEVVEEMIEEEGL